MANYDSLYSTIAENIFENHLNRVTAEMVKAACDSMVASLGYGYQFRGAAAPEDAGPGNIDQRVFYIASTPGTYSGFGGLTLAANEVALLKWDSAWSKETLDIPSKTQVMARLAAQDAQIAVQDGRLDGQDEEIADFKEAVQDQVDNYPMITIEGNVTNAPDEEDITSVEENGNNVLKFKNRSAVDGMGYVILRKGGSNTFANQVTAANTIYEIRYDFDLGGDSVTIPNGCVLKFNGGKLSNGTLVLNNTQIEGVGGFDTSIILTGSAMNEVLNADIYKLDATGTQDCTNAVQAIFNICKSKVVFSEGTYKFNRATISKDIIIDGNFAIFHSDPLASGYASRKNVITISGGSNAIIRNVHFEGAGSGTMDTTNNNESPLCIRDVDRVLIENCTFSKHIAGKYNVPSGETEYKYTGGCLTCTGFKNLAIRRCEFYDNNYAEWIWVCPSPTNGSYLLDDTTCVFEDNHIHNDENNEEKGLTPVNIIATNIEVIRNTIEHYSYRGSAFNTMGLNVFYKDNVIKGCHFRSGFDTCEWGQYRSDYVELSGNTIEVYNGCGCVINSKRAVICNNNISGENGVNVYCTYLDSAPVRPTADDNMAPFGAGKSIIITGNKINADYYDVNWKNPDDSVVDSGVKHGIFVQSAKEIAKDVLIENNDISIHTISGIVKNSRQPIYIKNSFGEISICKNSCDTDIVATLSTVDGGFVYITNTLDDNYKDIEIQDNIILHSATNLVLVDFGVTPSYSIISRILKAGLNNNQHIKDGAAGRIYIYQRNSVVEEFSILRQPTLSMASSYFAAVNLNADFVLPYEKAVTPKRGIQYDMDGNIVFDSSTSTLKRCWAKYYVSGQTGQTAAENKTLHIGDSLRVSGSRIYLLVSASCTFGATIPAVTETTDNTIVTWSSAKWLVLARNAGLPYGFFFGDTTPNMSAKAPYLYYNLTTQRLSLLRSGGDYDLKGWRNLGNKGNTSTMTGLSLNGADEGYLFYNTDIKLWCQLYIDRSGDTARSCWQVLGTGRGETAKRPTVLTNMVGVGFMYYDTDLSKLICWSGSAWTNVDGTSLN